MSRAIEVIDGGKLLLRRVHVVNGNATHAGGVLVEGAGSALVMEGASVRDSVATDPWGGSWEVPDGGGGGPHVLNSVVPELVGSRSCSGVRCGPSCLRAANHCPYVRHYPARKPPHKHKGAGGRATSQLPSHSLLGAHENGVCAGTSRWAWTCNCATP